MAIINENILKNCTGRIGNFIIYQRQGKTCIRTRPEGVAPKGAGQLAQQERIAAVVIFYKAVCAAGFQAYWKKTRRPLGWSGYNLFVHRNLPAFTGEGVIGDFDKLCLVEGTLQLPDNITIRNSGTGTWILEWTNTTLYSSCCGDDRMFIALMKCSDQFDIRIPDIGDFRRKDGKAVFSLPKEWKDYTYLFCYVCSKADGDISSSKLILNFKDYDNC